MTDLTRALESLSRAATQAGISIGHLSQPAQPPPSDGYEPMHIPEWWHEEYLKSLEPKPPFDLLAFLDRFAENFACFFQCFCVGLESATAFLFGVKRINR